MNFLDKIKLIEKDILGGVFVEEELEKRKFLYDEYLFPEEDSIKRLETAIRQALYEVSGESMEVYLNLNWSICHPCNYLKLNYPNLITSIEISCPTDYSIIDRLHKSSILSMRDIIESRNLSLTILKSNEST